MNVQRLNELESSLMIPCWVTQLFQLSLPKCKGLLRCPGKVSLTVAIVRHARDPQRRSSDRHWVVTVHRCSTFTACSDWSALRNLHTAQSPSLQHVYLHVIQRGLHQEKMASLANKLHCSFWILSYALDRTAWSRWRIIRMMWKELRI